MSNYIPYTYGGHARKLKYPETWPMPSEKERDARWNALRKAMAARNLDFIVAGAPPGWMPVLSNHMHYITNYVPFANPPGTFVVFPLKGEPHFQMTSELGIQFLHIAQETSWVSDGVISPNPILETVKRIKDLGLDKGRGGVVGYVNGIIAAKDYDALREGLPDAHLEDATPMLGAVQHEITRSSEEELGLLRKAAAILDKAQEALAATLKPGISELDLWAAAEHAILKNGGWCGHFIIGAVGEGPVFLRAPSTFKTLKKGDVIVFEIDSIYAGISPQACFALSAGEPSKQVGQMSRLVEELYNSAIEQLNNKRTFIEVELDLVKRIHAAGYEPITPQMHRYNNAYVMPMQSAPQPGDFWTLHPNCCNKEYTVGSKFGDAVRMGKDGKIERLNKPPAKLAIV